MDRLADDSVDMNFRYSSHGLLFTEIDLEKENKLSLKTPTAMKNFFLNLLRQRRASINMGIKTVGINVNGKEKTSKGQIILMKLIFALKNRSVYFCFYNEF